jgi:hypothetical protein
MKYLARVEIQRHLATLPHSVSFAGNSISGVLGSKRIDLSALREPFHREYANCLGDAKAVLKFVERFGHLDWERKFTGKTDLAGQEFQFRMEEWQEHRAKYLSAWSTVSRNSKGLPWNIVPSSFPLPYAGSTWMIVGDSLVLKGPETLWRVTENGPTALVYSQTGWEFLWLLLSFEKRQSLRICKNEGCTARYFIARRKDQVFCSADCSHKVAVRKWWARRGNEWRKSRKSKKSRLG